MLKIKKLRDSAIIPTRGTAESAGLDLYADIPEAVTIKPSQLAKITTGIAIALPKGTAGFIFGRSGLGAKHGICPSNAVGVVDSDYRGEIMVSLVNNAEESYTINPGDRIAQLIVMDVHIMDVQVCDELGETERGKSGFGSTGR